MDGIFNFLTWFLLTIMSARFSIDEIKRLCVKSAIQIDITTLCQELYNHHIEYFRTAP